MKKIAQGAEAVLYKKGKYLIKERIKKNYRIEEIDSSLRKSRTRKEVKLLKKLDGVIPVPLVNSVDEKKCLIEMEFIKGKKLSESLDNFTIKKRLEVCQLIGKQVALMHNVDIIHGDLTTSNMILGDKLYFIDFGLGFVDSHVEHKAVDLHLINQALESKHYRHYSECFNSLIKSYKKHCKDSSKVLERLEKVEKRGRYKKKN